MKTTESARSHCVLDPGCGAREVFETIGVPVRLVWGEEDRWVDPSLAERLQQEIPDSALDLVAGAGHFVMEDATQEVAAIFFDFFSKDARGT